MDGVEGDDDEGLDVFTGDGIGSLIILPLNGICGREIGT